MWNLSHFQVWTFLVYPLFFSWLWLVCSHFQVWSFYNCPRYKELAHSCLFTLSSVDFSILVLLICSHFLMWTFQFTTNYVKKKSHFSTLTCVNNLFIYHENKCGNSQQFCNTENPHTRGKCGEWNCTHFKL